MKNLKAIIESKRLTITKVAVNSNVSDSTIFAYINGQKIPSLPTLISLADYLDCNIDYLLDRAKNPMKINKITDYNQEISMLLHNYLSLSKEKKLLVNGYISALIDTEK